MAEEQQAPTTSIKENQGFNDWYKYELDQGKRGSSLMRSLAERAAAEEGFSQEQFDYAVNKGHSYKDMLLKTTSVRDLSGGEALLEGGGRGLARIGPSLLASVPFMAKGAALGAVGGPVGAFAGGLAGLVAAFLAGDYVGTELEKAVFSDRPILPEDQRMFKAGETAAVGLASIHPGYRMMRMARGPLSFGTKLAQSGGFGSKTVAPVGKAFEKIGKAVTDKKSLGKFAASEGLIIPGMAGGTYVMETFFPGNEGARIAGEIGGALINPLRVPIALARPIAKGIQGALPVAKREQIKGSEKWVIKHLKNLGMKEEHLKEFDAAFNNELVQEAIKEIGAEPPKTRAVEFLFPSGEEGVRGGLDNMLALLYRSVAQESDIAKVKEDLIHMKNINIKIKQVLASRGKKGKEALEMYEKSEIHNLIGAFVEQKQTAALARMGELEELSKIEGGVVDSGTAGAALAKAYGDAYSWFRNTQNRLADEIGQDRYLDTFNTTKALNNLHNKSRELPSRASDAMDRVEKRISGQVITNPNFPHLGLGFKVIDGEKIAPTELIVNNVQNLLTLRRTIQFELRNIGTTGLTARKTADDYALLKYLDDAIVKDIDAAVGKIDEGSGLVKDKTGLITNQIGKIDEGSGLVTYQTKDDSKPLRDAVKNFWDFTREGNKVFIKGILGDDIKDLNKEFVDIGDGIMVTPTADVLMSGYFKGVEAVPRTKYSQAVMQFEKKSLSKYFSDLTQEDPVGTLPNITGFEEDLLKALFKKQVLDDYIKPFYVTDPSQDLIVPGKTNLPLNLFDNMPASIDLVDIKKLDRFIKQYKEVLETPALKDFGDQLQKVAKDETEESLRVLSTFFMSKRALQHSIEKGLKDKFVSATLGEEDLVKSMVNMLPDMSRVMADSSDTTNFINNFSEKMKLLPSSDLSTKEVTMVKEGFFSNLLEAALAKYAGPDQHKVLKALFFGKSDDTAVLAPFMLEAETTLMDKLRKEGLVDDVTSNNWEGVLDNLISADQQTAMLTERFADDYLTSQKPLAKSKRLLSRTGAAVLGARAGSWISKTLGGRGSIQIPGLTANAFRGVLDDLPKSVFRNEIIRILEPKNRDDLAKVLKGSASESGTGLGAEAIKSLEEILYNLFVRSPITLAPAARQASNIIGDNRGTGVDPDKNNQAPRQAAPVPRQVAPVPKPKPSPPKNPLVGAVDPARFSQFFPQGMVTTDDLLRG
tara:strand:- start:41 stop:3676 length:3636 start_codon:yes stop_codon:yes gene_type:complete